MLSRGVDGDGLPRRQCASGAATGPSSKRPCDFVPPYPETIAKSTIGAVLDIHAVENRLCPHPIKTPFVQFAALNRSVVADTNHNGKFARRSLRRKVLAMRSRPMPWFGPAPLP